jgi:hypothetical protein
MERAADGHDVEAWKQWFQQNELFSRLEKKQWPAYLAQRNVLALLSCLALTDIGRRLYGFTKDKELEMMAYYEYDRAIKELDVGFQELIRNHVEAYEDDEAWRVAGIKDDHINPLIEGQYRILKVAREEIVNNKLDVRSFKNRLDEVEAKKNEIRADLGWT